MTNTHRKTITYYWRRGYALLHSKRQVVAGTDITDLALIIQLVERNTSWRFVPVELHVPQTGTRLLSFRDLVEHKPEILRCVFLCLLLVLTDLIPALCKNFLHVGQILKHCVFAVLLHDLVYCSLLCTVCLLPQVAYDVRCTACLWKLEPIERALILLVDVNFKPVWNKAKHLLRHIHHSKCRRKALHVIGLELAEACRFQNLPGERHLPRLVKSEERNTPAPIHLLPSAAAAILAITNPLDDPSWP
mmetsp:Transcript_6039/g.9670  ORF Transcript_6039/g.9670 Transcript_6039/m.9670 type:complete len:247 (+) Transcript_6039:1-741(+)